MWAPDGEGGYNKEEDNAEHRFRALNVHRDPADTDLHHQVASSGGLLGSARVLVRRHSGAEHDRHTSHNGN